MGPHRSVVDEGLLTVGTLVPHLPSVRGLVLDQLVPPDKGLVAGLTLMWLLVHVFAPHVLVQLVFSVVCVPTEVTFKVSGQWLVQMYSVDMILTITTEVRGVITALIGTRFPESGFPRPFARALVMVFVHQVMGWE